MAKAVIIAAPSSGSGKTVLTLGLLRALKDRGVRVASAKVGPDYIDPRFHEAATGRPCFNLDPWAMDGALIGRLLTELASDADLIVIEGVMGLFDGPESGRGSTADLAEDFGIPVILAVDCSHQAQSIAALVSGFANHRPGVSIAAVLLNRVASDRHETMLRAAVEPCGLPIAGAIRRDERLTLPSRHLGLVQAREHAELEAFIAYASATMAACAIEISNLSMAGLDPAIQARRQPRLADEGIHASGLDGRVKPGHGEKLSSPDFLTTAFPGTIRLALADDDAFAFVYPHLLHTWRCNGIDIHPFSPLDDEPPEARCDAVFLSGGYPELHAARLSANANFMRGLRAAAARGAGIYGECGGFMVLGDYLIDAQGSRHAMAGLLPLGTNFARRKLSLGYRTLRGQGDWKGHEFHYSTIDRQGDAEPLFTASDAAGRDLGPIGLKRGKVMGSYAHVIA